MSKSTTIFSSTQNTQIDEPFIQPFDAEHVSEFIKNTQKSVLDTVEKEKIKTAFEKNLDVIKFSELINSFITKINYFKLTGLSFKQVDELRQLLAKRKAFKEERKKSKDISPEQFKKFTVNEKAILPLNQVVEWWSINMMQLHKLKVWDDLAALTIEMNTKAGETKQVVRKRSRALTNLKEEWISQQIFAGIPSNLLLKFYDEYILTLEKDIAVEINKARIKPDPIYQYALHVQKQVRILKQHAIHSMLYRLRCAEYYGDLKCDDLLQNICARIKKETGIDVMKEGLVPRMRRSLTPELLVNFIKTITAYCRENQDEKMVATALSELKMNQVPEDMRELKTGKSALTELISHPVILYFANTSQTLLQQATQQANLTHTLMNTDAGSDRHQVLYKLRSLTKQAHVIYEQIMKSKPIASNNPIASMLVETDKKLKILCEDIGFNMESDIKNRIDGLLDEVFAEKEVKEDKIKAVIDQTTRANFFKSKYQGECFFASGDFILVLAHHLRNLTLHNHAVTKNACEQLLNLIKMFYPNLNSAQIDQYKETLHKLPAVLKSIDDHNSNSLFHYLTYYLEKPLIDAKQIKFALMRHKYIAQLYDEHWEELFDHTSETNESQQTLNIIGTYIKNVAIKLIPFSNTISLENFDNTESCSLGKELRKAIAMGGTTQLAKLEAIKSEFEKATLDKINDSLQIKNYLYIEEDKKIDIRKLRILIEKSKRFFSDAKLHDIFQAALLHSCLALVKNYCLSVIEHESMFDIDYIRQINDCFGEDVLKQLCKDNDLRNLLNVYVKSYAGNNNNLASLLIFMAPTDNLCGCEKHIVSYAKKRLEYIKTSRDISAQDYVFFAHYTNIPEIATTLKSYQREYKSFINDTLKNKKMHWSSDIASIVELFGSDQKVSAYRLKRLRELCHLDKLRHLDNKMAQKAFNKFMRTINPNRLDNNNRILDPGIRVNPQQTLPEYIDSIISERDWSMLLERIVDTFGNENQQHNLHFNHLMYYLNKSVDFTHYWLGRKIKRNDPDLTITEIPVKKVRFDAAQSFYLDLFGTDNIKKLIEKLNLILQKLMKLTSLTEKDDLSKDDYEAYTRMINCIKPLCNFYKLFGNNKANIQFFQNLNEFEEKINLHYELHSVLQRHTELIDISHENPALNDLIVALIQSVKNIEDKSILSEKSVDRYIAFIDKEILIKLEALLKTNHTLHFNLLSKLANLMTNLCSRSLKQNLLIAHKNNINDNPYWMSLINHLDEKTSLDTIEEATTNLAQHRDAHKDFFNTLNFAKRITNIKNLVNTAIKSALFNEAGIHLTNTQPKKMLDLIHANRIKDAQLLKLWRVCADKLNKDNLRTNTDPSHLNFIINILTRISDEIFQRSKSKPILLAKFIEQSRRLPEISAAIMDSVSSNNQQHETNPHSIWENPSESSHLLQPIYTISDKARALQLLGLVDQYIAKKLSKDKLALFKQACNDPKYNDSADKTEIRHLFGMKRDLDAMKIIQAMKIYNRLATIIDGKSAFKMMSAFIDTMVRDLHHKECLFRGSRFSSFLHDLQALTANDIAQQNDDKFGEKNMFPSLQ